MPWKPCANRCQIPPAPLHANYFLSNLQAGCGDDAVADLAKIKLVKPFADVSSSNYHVEHCFQLTLALASNTKLAFGMLLNNLPNVRRVLLGSALN